MNRSKKTEQGGSSSSRDCEERWEDGAKFMSKGEAVRPSFDVSKVSYFAVCLGLLICSCSPRSTESTGQSDLSLSDAKPERTRIPVQGQEKPQQVAKPRKAEPRKEDVRETMAEADFDDWSYPTESETMEDPQSVSTPSEVPPTYSSSVASPQTRKLVQDLIVERKTDGAVTDDEIDRWGDNFDQLVRQGSDALPAIREHLLLFEDTVFGPDEHQQLLGYPTTRIVLLDALHQIGGDDAIALSLETLQTTSDPAEIAFLVESLELQAGDEYRDAALAAARESLRMAKEGGAEAQEMDVGPLFEVLSRYGDERIVPDLVEATEQWNYYGLISLAELSEGAGIPKLIDIAQDQDSTGSSVSSQALVLLAQVSTQSDEARETLVQQAKSGQIPQFYWHSIAETLAGDTYRVGTDLLGDETPGDIPPGHRTHFSRSGNQLFSSSPSYDWSVDEIDERIALIDELLSVNSTPTVVDLLNKSRGELLNRVELMEPSLSMN